MNVGFLARDPVVALEEVKARLYGRLERSRDFIEQYGVSKSEFETRAASFDQAVKDEIAFLQNLLHDIERS